MHQIRFRWGSVSDPAGGAYSTPPDTLAGFKGPTSKERKEGEGRVEKERGSPPFQIPVSVSDSWLSLTCCVTFRC